MPFYRTDQPADQEAQLPPVKTIMPENGSEVTDSGASNSITTIASYDRELEEVRRGITPIPADYPGWLRTSRGLASLLLKRFEDTSQDTLLAECIDIQRHICSVCTPGSPDRALSVSDLASSLRTLFQQRGEESLLSEAIDLDREALSLRPRGDPDRSQSCNNLAYTLWMRFNQMGDEALLTEAIDLHREALSLRHSGHPDRSMSCNNLAISLKTCFDQTGDESLLTEAIDLHREAFSLRTSGHPDRYKSCSNLATSLCTRFRQTGAKSLLAESIDLFREALSLCPIGHPNRSHSCNNLALSLEMRFDQTGEESLLAEAIELYREALSLRPDGNPYRCESCNNLANALLLYFKQTSNESMLAEAIELHREALSLRPSGHPLRFMSCNNVANTLYACFKRTGHKSLLAEAIGLYREAMSLQTGVHPGRLEVCNALVSSLRALFELTGDESLLVEAINLSKDAIETQPPHHPSRWKLSINLGHIYLNRRFSQHKSILAIDYIHQALSIVSHEWPILLCEVSQLASLIDLPALSSDALTQLLQCLSAAIDLASRVAGFVLDPQSQLRYLSSSQHLGPRAYWCAVACGQPQVGLELIEQARAMIWNQALQMRSPQLCGAPPDLASELQILFNGIRTLRVAEDLTSSSSHDQDVRHKSSDRIHQIIQEIRALPGKERFMQGLSCKELAQCACRNAVVVLVATEGECHALILQPNNQEPVTLKLSSIVPTELTSISINVSAARRGGSTPDNVCNDYRGIKAAAHKTRSEPALGKLWVGVVKPIFDYMQLQKATGLSRPRLHWCPTGPFTFLPLHAAGIYDGNNGECCADYVVSSYTPTLTALLRAQKSSPIFHRREAKLGLVAATETWDVGLPALQYVQDEVNLVRAAAKTASISVDDSNTCVGHVTTVGRASEVLKNTNLVHIACHGTQNTMNALSSGYCLGDGNLTVSQLMKLDLKDAFFAFLSACETAKGDEKQPDQTVHLAAAMLFVGLRSVIATMWAMDDTDGPLVAELFYKRLFVEDVISLDSIPYALDYAVAELRRIGATPERWATFIHVGA